MTALTRLRCGLALVLSALAGTALAGACTLSSSALVFGAYQPLTLPGKLLSVDQSSMATVSMVCNGITVAGSYRIALGAGNHGPGNRIHARYLHNAAGGSDMAYNVYLDAGNQAVWGNGVTGTLLGGSIPAGTSNQQHTVFGRIPAGQNSLRAGSFSDVLVITVSYQP